jgi:SAM-dependent methyltransferase
MTVEESLSDAEIGALYGEDYFRGREYIDYAADKPAVQKTLAGHWQRVRQHVAPGGRLLEIGCAHGFFLELIAREFPQSVGVDISPEAVAHAQRTGLDARAGNLLEMPRDGPFDAVCLWDTIEHLARPRACLERATGELRPGGHLFLTTGDFGSRLARWQGLKWRQIHPPTHLFYFTRPSLKALCRHLGLQVVAFHTVTVHRRVRSALEALARFHPTTASGRFARLLLVICPRVLLDQSVPLNLGDTMLLVARKLAAE